MKKRNKQVRKFISGNKDCTAVMSWNIDVSECYRNKKKLSVDANFNVTEEGRWHYVSRKAHLKTMYAMRDEINTFIKECEQALKDVETHNAQSKDTS